MSKERHSNDLSGKGAELAGGRWNEIGIPALYLAENISLSILETIVHCQRVSDLHNRLVLSIKFPEESIDEIEMDQLPNDWNKAPWHNYTINYGSNWLSSHNNFVLKIPSAIVPNENIFLVNPHHKNHSQIKVVNKNLFLPDNRLKLSN
ncbi:MAG: RES domain-containing protein [Leptospirales bacterium]